MTDMAYNGLRLRLNPYSGYGSFYVDYCDQFLEWRCGKTDGVICEIVISSADRAACANQYSGNNTYIIDFVEVLVVTIEKPLNFGYEISLFEESTDNTLLVNERLLALFVP